MTTIQLSSFQKYILMQFMPNKEWYLLHFMNFLLSKNIAPIESEYAIYQLRLNGMLVLHTDFQGQQYLKITYLGIQNLTKTNVYNNQNIDLSKIDKKQPNEDEIKGLEQTKKSDETVRILTIENFHLQRSKFKFEKWMSTVSLIISLISMVIAIFSYYSVK